MIGPSIPANIGLAQTAGPQLPPSHSTNANATNEDSDSDDDFSPSLPPDMLAARANPSSAPVAGPVFPFPSTSTKKVLGPTLPPGFSSSSSSGPRRETPLSNRYLDDDDDFGPQPVAPGSRSGENEGVREFREREERELEKKRKETEAGKGKMKREEWMMVPPEDVDLLSSASFITCSF